MEKKKAFAKNWRGHLRRTKNNYTDAGSRRRKTRGTEMKGLAGGKRGAQPKGERFLLEVPWSQNSWMKVRSQEDDECTRESFSGALGLKKRNQTGGTNTVR